MLKKTSVYIILLWPVLSIHALMIEGFTPSERVTYKTIDKDELKLHIFYPENHNKETDKRPAIIFFFGGGWVGGDPSQFFPQCQHLASRGMVAISAEYRIRSRHKTTPQECVKDGKSAVRWIRKNAPALGVDPNAIVAGGGSAGGHVAAATGTLKGFEEDGEDLSISARPNALVLFNPVFDNGPGGYGHQRVKDYWEAFSPLHNINKNTPPTVVLTGTEDKHVSVETFKEFQSRMQAIGLRSELHLYEGQVHGFFNLGRGFYEQPLKDMDRFLVSLGYLSEQ